MNARFVSSPLLLALLSVCLVAPAAAENWPSWRGPRRDGVSLERNLPTKWSSTQNVVWRAPLPGPAGSTPVVWDERIFLTAVDGDRLVLLCLDTSGKKLWQQALSQGNVVVREGEGNSASASPSTDGQCVWAMFSNGVLGCYDFAGNEVWKLDLQERYGEFEIQFGMTSTPLLDGDRLYLQLIHGRMNQRPADNAVVVALDKNTGREIWKQYRVSEAVMENKHSYASPVLYRDDTRAFLLTHGADYIIAHDLQDGSELWRCGGLHPPNRYDPFLRFVSSPLAVPGLIVVPSAKGGVTLGLKPDGKGVVTEDANQRYWTFPVTPDVPSPLVVDDIVYLCQQNGTLIALDRYTGEEFYRSRTHAANHRASPVYVDGKILLTARDGTISVCKPGREFSLLASNQMEEPISASPVISNGRIYLRTFESLYAIGNRD